MMKVKPGGANVLLKFTDITPHRQREIHMSLDVSRRPPHGNSCVPPSPPDSPLPGPYGIAALEGGVYVYVSVKDSGPGLK